MVLGLHPELLPGREISARSFDDAGPRLAIRVSASEMARGGSAVVLKGDMVSPWHAVVALKVVMDGPGHDSNDYHERIRRETVAVQNIHHRFILPFLGVLVHDSYTVLVSPFMENGDLLAYLNAKPGANRRSLIIQVADAVDYLHTQAGLVHGDLKCQNVLVSPHGDAQLADFGLCTAIEKSLSLATTTFTIRQLYTLQFAAPELLTDEAKSASGKTRSKTTQTDVFAFGRLMLQAFTGTVPWPDLPLRAVFHKVLKNIIPERRNEATALGLDDEWWFACIACWRTVPQERPTMAQVMLKLIKNRDQPRPSCIFSRKPRKTWSLPTIVSTKRVRPPNPFAPPVRSAELVHGQSAALSSLSSKRPPKATRAGMLMRLTGRAVAADTVAPARHHGFECAHCQLPIVGVRYQCATCPSFPSSYNLCEACERRSYVVHDDTHVFFKLPRPVARPIASASPFLPTSYRKAVGLLLADGTRDDDADPEGVAAIPSCRLVVYGVSEALRRAGEGYLLTVRKPMTLCDWCVEPIEGKWYRCVYCGKGLCDACEAIDAHDDSHVFIVFKAQVDMILLGNCMDLDNPRPLIPHPVYLPTEADVNAVKN